MSFEAAINRLGALPIMLRPDELQLGRGEPIADTARVLSSYCEAIVDAHVRAARRRELAEHASVPVINALTDDHHPCQALADCLTLRERFGSLDGLPVAYVGDGNNVAHSLIEAAALTGMELRVAIAPGLRARPARSSLARGPHAQHRRRPARGGRRRARRLHRRLGLDGPGGRRASGAAGCSRATA